MKEILRIRQLDPGDENCENYAFIPYPHTTPQGQPHEPLPIRIIRLSQTTYSGGFANWRCECGTILEFIIPVDSDLE
ncbi:hypothetical protein A2363_01440 [Candidatus Gottesmanbacteria bacterium RIFOXYB1_FULL_47_11]|uniref:Uncharacterized protein n=1 Tax=Candidatus Gottesmanbacteria bacterium RIFOXYB1_FULL_47_11 TaxID=1798401 RepID=A0A1F6BDX7_9BACT|nr:MAG: hypothetical protein A2363_01440 [Candidatus Gottesmanbacteria bacterium RIFOXYB1_FULL_47_11]